MKLIVLGVPAHFIKRDPHNEVLVDQTKESQRSRNFVLEFAEIQQDGGSKTAVVLECHSVGSDSRTELKSVAKPGKQRRGRYFIASTEPWDDLQSLRDEFGPVSVVLAEVRENFLTF